MKAAAWSGFLGGEIVPRLTWSISRLRVFFATEIVTFFIWLS
jgi:hypothetical protein